MNKAEEKTGQVERTEKVEKVEKIEKIEKIEIDGMEEERNLGNDYYDGTGFFNYDDYYDWSNSAIKPQSCYNSYVSKSISPCAQWRKSLWCNLIYIIF